MQRINIDLDEANNKENGNSINNVVINSQMPFFFKFCSVISLKWESHFSTGEEGDSEATA